MFLKYLQFGWEDDTDVLWTPEKERGSPASARRYCTKYHNHRKYIDIAKMTPEDIPGDGKAIRDQLFECIKSIAKLTCRIQHGDFWGTGFVQRVRVANKCPINDCCVTEAHGSVIVKVTSVSSVLSENLHSEAEEDTSLLIENLHSNPQFIFRQVSDKASDCIIGDWCELEFVTHDLTVEKKLRDLISDYESRQKTLYEKVKSGGIKVNFLAVIGYPHGDKKVVSFGKILKRTEVRKTHGDQQWCEYYYDAPTCPGSGGSSLLIPGQPLAGYGYWFGHPHLHNVYNCRIKQGRSSIGSDYWSDADKNFVRIHPCPLRKLLNYKTYSALLVGLAAMLMYYFISVTQCRVGFETDHRGATTRNDL